MQDLHLMSATDLVEALADGRLTCVEVTKACLARINERDGEVQAFAYIDHDYALKQATRLDEIRPRGFPLGPLHGVPVAVKDIIDTGDMPTENGLAHDAGRRSRDSTVTRRLRAAGAVILGKTATTEAAYYQPAKTRNPHNLEHTPGGSSAGSAAAVADFMVPLAVGTQTNGSVIRPASFCGVVGFKPGFGQIARTGILKLCPSLDQVGTFARTVNDAALLADVLVGDDGVDESVLPAPAPRFAATAATDVPVKPVFAFISPPDWVDAPQDARDGFAELCNLLGERVDIVPLPAIYDECISMHRVVMAVEMSRNLSKYAEAKEPISDHLSAIIEEGKAISAHDYLAARDWQDVLASGVEKIMERYDAILTPASYGEAPKTLEQTGDPRACTLWSYTGVPAVTLPLLVGDNNMPIGVQLISAKHEDGRLLRVANWLIKTLSAAE